MPIRAIIGMARTIAGSGQVGIKGSKAEAEDLVRQYIGNDDIAFTERHGSNYWSHLKGLLSEYVVSRGLESGFVVKGAPFNWHSTIGTKCSAVILRRDFFRGDAHVEPELYLDAGLLVERGGETVPGVACGFHYLRSNEGDASRFVQGVLMDDELRTMAWGLSSNGFINPAYRSGGPTGFWNMEASLYKSWPEDLLPSDLKAQVFRAFDELLPLYLRVTSL